MSTTELGLSELVGADEDYLVDIRRHLHAQPELSHEEFNTTALVIDEMKKIGASQLPLDLETGAAFALQGGRPGKTVLLRADLDALPVTETRDLSFRSAVEGIMHACGHDAHTAGLIGSARALAKRLEDLPGKYVFAFQPAEETLGGALAMIDAGLLEQARPDVSLGWHSASIAPLGFIGLRNQVMMAESQSFAFHAAGQGGHGALASSLGGNVLLAVAGLARRLDDVVENLIYEGTACACSAGILQAGTAANVIPAHAQLRGTLRTFTPEQYATACARLRDLAAECSAAEGVTVTLELGGRAPAVINDPRITDIVRASGRAVLGDDRVLELPPVTPSEDMSEFLNRVPGCFFFVGGALADGSSGGHHQEGFALDDACVALGASVLGEAARHCAELESTA
ncbi:MAG: M20 family metallopeptidase [Actinomycetota bacterium]